MQKIDYQKELNNEQLAVVKNGDGPCLVLAGAGSGKTRTLVYRVAYLLEQGIDPKNILLMTFTNKAAKEMLTRVSELLGKKPTGLWGGTFHHIGNRILRKYASFINFSADYNILDEEDSKALIKAIIDKLYPHRDKNFPKSGIIKNITSFATNSGQTIETVFKQKYYYLKNNNLEAIEKIYKNYIQQKKELNVMDYDDLLKLWLQLLKTNKEIKNKLSKQFQYILIDEYQDTNFLQGEIIKSLAGTHKNILAVGDDAQSIYSFRAADINNILSFPKNFSNAKIFKLETNYRSTPEILNLANDSIAKNSSPYQKNLHAVKPSQDKPLVISAANNACQASFILNKISQNSLADSAVLFRADYHALELELELNRRGIPYIKRGGIKFFEQAHLKDIIAFLKIINNIHDDISWRRILNIQSGIGPATINKILSAKKGKDLKQTLKLKNVLSGPGEQSWQQLTKLLLQISKITSDNIPQMIQLIIDNFYSQYLQSNFDNAEKRMDDLNYLTDFASRYQTLADFLSDISLAENFSIENQNNQDYLTISTIHQAKGLEWSNVFIIGLVEGMFPHNKAETLNELEEERRLFYVAATRAKNNLYLVYPQINYRSGQGFSFNKPSNFLTEINPELFEKIEITEDDTNIIQYD